MIRGIPTSLPLSRLHRRTSAATRMASYASLVSLVAVSGCVASLGSSPYAEVSRTPRDVLPVAEEVFRTYDIPVQPRMTGAQVVESGRFVRSGSWGGESIERRVDCGTGDDGLPRALEGEVALNMELTVGARRVVLPGRAEPAAGSHVEVDGEAVLEGGVRCRLRREFMAAIVCAVADRTGRIQSNCHGSSFLVLAFQGVTDAPVHDVRMGSVAESAVGGIGGSDDRLGDTDLYEQLLELEDE